MSPNVYINNDKLFTSIRYVDSLFAHDTHVIPTNIKFKCLQKYYESLKTALGKYTGSFGIYPVKLNTRQIFSGVYLASAHLQRCIFSAFHI